jgi:hypothetical protein
MAGVPAAVSLNDQANARSAAKRHMLISKIYHHAPNEPKSDIQFDNFTMLHECGYSIEQIGFMSLQTAAKSLSADKVEALLAAGALHTMPEDSKTKYSLSLKDQTPPIFLACRQKGPNAIAVVEILLRAGVEINKPIPSSGQTALHLAAAGSDAGVVRFLLNNSADIEQRTKVMCRSLSFTLISVTRTSQMRMAS